METEIDLNVTTSSVELTEKSQNSLAWSYGSAESVVTDLVSIAFIRMPR